MYLNIHGFKKNHGWAIIGALLDMDTNFRTDFYWFFGNFIDFTGLSMNSQLLMNYY